LTVSSQTDDALAYPEVRQRTYPPTVVERMKTVTTFVRSCTSCSSPRLSLNADPPFFAADNVLQKLMAVLEVRLGLPVGTFAALHKEGDISGSESRCIYKAPPGGRGFLAEGVGEDGNPAAAIGYVRFLFFVYLSLC
jgi:hypothetical protein